MNRTDPRAIVESYLAAIGAHDYEGARRHLADTGFRYDSPISSFSDPDDFIQQLSLSAAIVQRIEPLKAFVDGRDVCHFLRFTIQLSEKESVKVAHWARVVDGRIQQLDVVFDAHVYRRMFEAPP